LKNEEALASFGPQRHTKKDQEKELFLFERIRFMLY
jgi:hypothetical protein